MAVDIQWVNFDVVQGGGALASAMKRDSSGVDFALSAGAYVAPFLDSLNPGGLAAMDVVVPPGAAIKIQMYAEGSTQVIAPTTLGGGTYSATQLTMTASGTPTWDIPPGRALRCWCVSATGGTFHLSPLRLASAPVGTPYWWGPATLGGTASLPSPDTADPRGAWELPATAGLTLIGTKAWTGAKTFTVPFYRTGAGTINAKITATTGTATLVTADGATVNGDGSLTIPADTHLFPSWTATDGATLTLTKGAGYGYAFYGPLYLDETVVPPTPPPTITKIIPTSGPDTGGTSVDIIGTDLTGATAVDFGGNPGTGLTVDPSGGLATVTSPAHTAGPAPVTITTPAGTSNAATFLFTPPSLPVIKGFTPVTGEETGGTRVVMGGDGIPDVTEVTFGGTPGTDLVIDPAGYLGVTTPVHTPGSVEVRVTNPIGTSSPVGPYPFTFTATQPPLVSQVYPTGGTERGGTQVLLSGIRLADVTEVTFGGVPGTNIFHGGDTSLLVTSPVGSPGTVDLVATNPIGSSNSVNWTYTPTLAPVIDLGTPDEGYNTGGTVVSLTGKNFLGVSEVTFDGLPGVNLFVPSDDVLIVTAPPHAAGQVSILATSPSGVSLPFDWTYISTDGLPDIYGIVPSSGPKTGGTEITLIGKGFVGLTSITIEGKECFRVTVLSDTEATCVTTSNPVGSAQVIATNSKGASPPANFTYFEAEGGTGIDNLGAGGIIFQSLKLFKKVDITIRMPDLRKP